MKKTIALLSCLLILVSCIALAGCGKQDLTNSKYVGTWIANRATILDNETPMDEAFPGGMTLKLNPDGTALLTTQDESSNCTWSETSKGVKFKGDMKVKADAEGDELVMKIIGVHLHFVKLTETAAAVNSIGSAIGSAVSDVVSDAVSGAVEVANDATSSTAPEATGDTTTDAVSAANDAASNAVSAANDAASNAVSAANDAANSAVSAANDAANSAVSAANDAINGIASGIASLTGDTAAAQ